MAVKFYEIVEQVKLLSQDDKLYLKDILDKILIEEKRKAIKTHADESVTEYREGKIKFGTIAEMKKDIHEN